MKYSMHQLIRCAEEAQEMKNTKKAVTKTIDAHDARVHFGQLLDEVKNKEHTFFIKRRGKVTAVILNPDRKSTRLNSSHNSESRMPSSA
jgi:hypothetical protein